MSARAWTAFAFLSAVWGVPYLFIKIVVDDGVPPIFLAWSRVLLAATVLLSLAWRAGVLGSLAGRWRWIALYAVVEIVGPFPLIAAGEQRVASSLASICIATVPLIIALLALRFDHSERATGKRLVGLVIGLSGVVVLVGIDIAGSSRELIGAFAVLLAAVGYAAGPMVMKARLRGMDPRAAMGASLGVAAVVLTPPALLAPPHEMPGPGTLLSIAVLGLLCTAAAFVVLWVLVGEVGAGRAAVITYINPVIAVALGVTLLHEHPGAGAVAGLLLILAGSWLSTDGRLPPGLRVLAERRTASRRRPEPRGVQAEAS